MSAALFPDAPLAVQQALGRLVESGSTVTYYGKEGKKSTSQVWGALKTQVAAGLQRRVAAGNALQPGQAQPQGMPADLPHSYVGASSSRSQRHHYGLLASARLRCRCTESEHVRVRCCAQCTAALVAG